MTDPHCNRRPDAVTVRGPGLAHLICTVRHAHACVLQLVLHTFDSQPPSLRERFARRHPSDVVVVELGLN